MALGYRQSGVSGRVTADGRDLPASQIAVEFPLDGIPRARVSLALGESAAGKQYLAEELKQAAAQAKIEIKLTISQDGRLQPSGVKLDEKQVPVGEFLFFRGYRAGYSYERTGTAASLSFDVDHWVSDLARSSSLSPGLAPGNIADLSFPGVLRAQIGQQASGGVGVFNLGKDVFQTEVTQDLWVGGIYKWFNLLAKSDHLADSAKTGNYLLSRLLGSQPDKPNARAVAALADMVRPAGMAEAEFPKLTLRRPGADAAAQAIAKNIHAQIVNTAFETLAMRTLWDQLVSMASEFMFAVSPAVDVVRPVPWTPSLKTPWRRISGYEDNQFSGQGNSQVPLRGMALLTNGSWDTGANALASNQATPIDANSSARLGLGSYVNPTAKDGLVFVRTPPAWLANIPDGSKQRQDVDRNKLLQNGAADVKAGDANAVDPGPILDGMHGTLCRFARATYAFETFRQRQMVLHTPLRFDIAPGSIVAVEVVGTDRDPTDRTDFYAAVTGVSYFIDVENRKADMSFSLAHVRTTAENSDANLSVSEHPLYSTSWSGGKLVEF